MQMRLIVGISGASGVVMGYHLPKAVNFFCDRNKEWVWRISCQTHSF
jgi:3-polyprenyl-4-hydroxybenzoate decarboxylase